MSLKDKFILWWYRNELDESYIDEYAEEPTVDVLVKRVKLLFKLHGVSETEIPEVYPKITFKDLSENALLLDKLTPEFLNELAEFFDIRVDWLRSGEPSLFYPRYWYKDKTKGFFEDLKKVDFKVEHNPFEIITTEEKFDFRSEAYQPFILVVKVPIAQIDDRTIYRYLVGSEWHWQHATCRLGAKAIATRYYQLTGRMIFIYTTTKDNFKKLSAQLITPNFNKMMNHHMSFEEYGALKFRHLKVPYENFEYAEVAQEVKQLGLELIQYDYLQVADVETENNLTQEDLSLQQIAARAKHEPISQIKRECIEFWINNKKLSNNETARRFYKSLSSDRSKHLAETNAVLTLSKAISQYKRKDTLKKLPNWLEGFKPEIL